VSTNNTPALQPKTIAFHEAGHAIAGAALQREFTRLSIVPVNGEPTGCKWAAGHVEEWVWIICSMAGPRAQVQFCQNSLSKEKLDLFQETILLPTEKWDAYSYTGWFSGNKDKPMDLDPILGWLQKPQWPVPGLERVTIAELTSAVDETLKAFFQKPSVVAAVTFAAEALLKTPVISCGELKELLQQIRQRLIQDDYLAVLPPCARA
jgi:hypothetical protein